MRSQVLFVFFTVLINFRLGVSFASNSSSAIPSTQFESITPTTSVSSLSTVATTSISPSHSSYWVHTSTMEPTHSNSITKTAQSTTNTAQSTTKPAHSTIMPSQSTTKPPHSTTKPAQSTMKPPHSTIKPSHSTKKPTQSTIKPQPVVVVKYECGKECQNLKKRVWAAGFFAVLFSVTTLLFMVLFCRQYRMTRDESDPAMARLI